MRIVTWNCHGKYREKEEYLLQKYHPDIAVIQESENPASFRTSRAKVWAVDPIWEPLKNDTLGLGVYFYSPFEVSVWPNVNREIKTFIPLLVHRPSSREVFHILAVYANNPPSGRRFRYIQQVWLALQYYRDFLAPEGLIVGDFNSYRLRTSSKNDVARELAQRGYQSLYHHHFREELQHHSRPTLYWRYNPAAPYMVDYCFASPFFLRNLSKNAQAVQVGSYEEWVEKSRSRSVYSDHVPLVFDFNL